MKSVIALFLLGTLAMGCQNDGVKTTPPKPGSNPSSGKFAQLSQSNLQFGLSLFKALNKAEAANKNILISPYSVQTAMHMTANATAGSSRDQMLKGLYMGDWKLPDLNQRHRQWHQSVIKKPSHPTISSTNGFFKDPERLKANKDFTDHLQKYYNAKLMDLDFDQANQAKQRINDWVKQQTQDKIDKIVEKIRPDDVGFLINALYYKADWKRPFPEARTSKRTFQKQSGQSIQVPFMSRDGRHHFHKGDRFKVLDKPFKGGKFSLTVVAPTNEQSLKATIAGLQPSALRNLYQKLDTGRAIVLLPKMDLSYKEKLIDDLEAPLGLNLKNANIQNMGESLIGGRLKITRVVHKSVLKIDEKGAEGAAVTSVGATATSAPPMLIFDEPFMVMLRHVPTNSLLFMGKVMKP